MQKSDAPELVGLAEIAEMAGISRQAVSNWRSRNETFPEPLAELKSGPVWRLSDIVTWGRDAEVVLRPLSTNGVRVATNAARTVAIVNMKGGVGKSTLTANLGWYAAYKRNLRVLLVDLDPQFNLSQYTLGPEKYSKHIDEGKPTVVELLEQYTPSVVSGHKTGFNPVQLIVNVAHRGTSRLDLIPSRLELAWTLKNPNEKDTILNDYLDSVRAEYDLILIDCPPTESVATAAAYLACDSVLVPVRPEFLSTIGLPLLARSLREFGDKHKDKEIEFLGVVFNAVSDKVEHDRSRTDVNKSAAKEKWYVFENEVWHSDSYAAGSRAGRPIFQTDYARYTKIKNFEQVAEEFMRRIGY